MHKKKVNYYLLLFLFCVGFLVWGLCSSAAIQPVGESLWSWICGEATFEETKTALGDALDKNLTYHYDLLELNGLKENLLGTRVIKKYDTVIVKTDSGSLAEETGKLASSNVMITAAKIAGLRTMVENSGARFLYCAAPEKEMWEQLPSNVRNYAQYNYDLLLKELDKGDVPYVDFSQTLREETVDFPVFYNTDHHWTARAGFASTDALVEELKNRYGFEPNEEALDIANYNVEEYEDWFLGSKGKKVGSAFTWNGADDFELITPKFETDMLEQQPFKNSQRKGTFDRTVLYQSQLKKDYYKKNSYATYSGGDFRLQIMKNNLNPDGKKVLLIRDSFACVVAPFLSLQTSELHVCDVRDGQSYVGEKLNVAEYIREIQPDYVLVLYTGVAPSSNGKYNFY